MTYQAINPNMDLSPEDAVYVTLALYRYAKGRLVTEMGDRAFLDIENKAREAAESLIVDGGYGPDDSDLFGSEMGDLVQTLLMCAIMRQPDMVDEWNEKGMLAL